MAVRFSTVAGERGSPDTWRDPRGFALKFYTTEGNYDMVGNNTPVFFVKDPMKFQHFIRSQKRRADNNLRDHDMQWDFWTLSPESAHQVTWLMGDRGIPRTWRHMNGYTSHTYMWINAAGEQFWVKYTFKTDQGVQFFTQDEADQMAAVDTDYHTRDLFEHIRDGEYPSWTLYVQVMPFEDAKTYRFNPFDLTKVWPHGDYPLIEVGRMTLDRNATDNHTEIEQLAFQPNNLVPGIGPEPGPDAAGAPVLLRRRAPLPPRRQLPADPGERAAVCPVHSYSKDGAMRIHPVTDPVYAPNSKGGPAADTERYGRVPTWYADGDIMRTAYVDHAEDDDWGQAGTLVRDVLDDAARDRLVDNVVGHLLNGGERAGAAARVRLLAQHRRRASAPGSRRACCAKADLHGPEGRGAGQPGPVEHAGESLGRCWRTPPVASGGSRAEFSSALLREPAAPGPRPAAPRRALRR